MNCEKDKKNNQLSVEDQKIWDKYAEELSGQTAKDTETEDFEALLETHGQEQESEAIEETKAATPTEKSNMAAPSQADHPAQIDRRTLEKLRKGQINIEAKLDLHGMRQTEAYDALSRFIAVSIQQKLRCVLIITGKGKSRVSTTSIIEPEKGVLKQKLPQWLEDTKFKKDVLTIMPAHIKHGGSGAFYVYLKKVR